VKERSIIAANLMRAEKKRGDWGEGTPHSFFIRKSYFGDEAKDS